MVLSASLLNSTYTLMLSNLYNNYLSWLYTFCEPPNILTLETSVRATIFLACEYPVKQM